MLKNNRNGTSSSEGGNQQCTVHWNQGRSCRTLTLLRRKAEDLERLERVLDEAVGGGSEHGQLILLHPFPAEDYKSWLRSDGSSKASSVVVLLEVDGHQVSGFTRKDLLAWMTQCLLRTEEETQEPRPVQLVTAPITGESLCQLL